MYVDQEGRLEATRQEDDSQKTCLHRGKLFGPAVSTVQDRPSPWDFKQDHCCSRTVIGIQVRHLHALHYEGLL